MTPAVMLFTSAKFLQELIGAHVFNICYLNKE